jgi:hypothetical protein
LSLIDRVADAAEASRPYKNNRYEENKKGCKYESDGSPADEHLGDGIWQRKEEHKDVRL